MSDFGYDEEAVYQDADILMMAYEAEANQMEAIRRRGVCLHQSWVGLPASGEIFYPEQADLKPGEIRCTEGCGRKFSSEEEREREVEELML